MRTLGEINRGGFGVVDRVQLSNGSVVARKTFDPIVGGTSDEVEKLKKRFEREVKTLKMLACDSLIPVLEDGLDDDPMWFTMPLAKFNLHHQILGWRSGDPFELEPLLHILDGLDQLHRSGYVHRDLKPENVLLHDGRWKLADFGLIMPPSGSTARYTSVKSTHGTRAYEAPEQQTRFKDVGTTADIYSFGCILHDIFGSSDDDRVPFQRHSSEGQIGVVIEKCTEFDPTRRFQSVQGLRNAVLRALMEPDSVVKESSKTIWTDELASIGGWDENRFFDLTRHILKFRDPEELGELWLALDSKALESIAKRSPETFSAVAESYCAWAHGDFSFEQCDVVVGLLETVLEFGANDLKAVAALAAAALGARHNRWHVMHRLLGMCGDRLSSEAALKISLEIEASEAQYTFVRCVESIGEKVTEYHPTIARVLTDWEETRNNHE